MSPEELEIASIYSGRSRSSMYSTVSQVSGATIATMKFHSEGDILFQHSLPIKVSNSLNVISKKRRAKTLLRTMLPKLFRTKKKSNVSVTDDEKDSCEFPILDLSEEPILKLEGEHVYSHYYFDDEDPRQNTTVPASIHGTSEECSSMLAATTLQELNEFRIPSESSDSITGGYGSKSDVESGLGSQNLVNTTSEDDFQLFNSCSGVQRSQSMKYQCFTPTSNLKKGGSGGLSLRKLNPSLHTLHQASHDRVDTPSSGYGESQSGSGSIQSSLYSLSSNIPLDGAPADFLYHQEGLQNPHYFSSSLKRNSTSVGQPTQMKERVKSARSHSFNGKLTVHHE
jgi:hypothetical protein